jgi:hypothetical protein
MVDIGYVGRLSHKLLVQQDVNSPLIYFKDPKSGQNWVQTDTAMRQLYNNGVYQLPLDVEPWHVWRIPDGRGCSRVAISASIFFLVW